MTVERAEGHDGTIEFDWKSVTITRKGRRAKKNPPLVAPLDGEKRVFFREPSTLTFGQLAVLGLDDRDPKRSESGDRIILFSKPELAAFRRVQVAIELAIGRGAQLTEDEISFHQKTADELDAAEREKAQAELDGLLRKASGAIYAGHVVDYKGYRYGLGLKRPIAGATAEFESGADRSRPTLTRIGGGALLAGPVGAIAGGMFKKDKTKGYVTIVFSDGATVIVEGPAKDEKKMREFASGVTAIAAAEARREGLPAGPEVVSGESPADQLLKLKQLLDAGVLTQEQYDEKAAPLLAQL